MPSALITNAEKYLEEKAEKFPYLIITPIGNPYPEEVDHLYTFEGKWIAGIIKGEMHWRFTKAEDADLFRKMQEIT